MTTNAGASFSGRTAWARNIAAPIRNYLSTESGSAMVLLAATVAAMLWANSPWGDSYESVWETTLQVQLGGDGAITLIDQDGETVQVLHEHEGPVLDAAISPDGSEYVATLGGLVRVRDRDQG